MLGDASLAVDRRPTGTDAGPTRRRPKPRVRSGSVSGHQVGHDRLGRACPHPGNGFEQESRLREPCPALRACLDRLLRLSSRFQQRSTPPPAPRHSCRDRSAEGLGASSPRSCGLLRPGRGARGIRSLRLEQARGCGCGSRCGVDQTLPEGNQARYGHATPVAARTRWEVRQEYTWRMSL